MTHRAQLTVAVLVVGIIAVLTVGFVLGRAALLDNELLRARLTEKLADWTGGTVELKGPIHLSYLPTLAFEVENVAIDNVVNLPMVEAMETQRLGVDLAFWSLLTGEVHVDHLRLGRPDIRLRADWTGGQADLGPAFVRALRSAPFSAMEIENGRLAMISDQGKAIITALKIESRLASDGASSTEGRFVWRGQPLTFTLSNEAPTVVANAAKAALELSIESPDLSAQISGEVTIADAPQVAGTVDLRIPNLRHFVNWAGLLLPEGQGLGVFTASGSMNWVGKRLSVADGTFSLDGNQALGTLALRLAHPRPAIEGTLALKVLTFDQYLASHFAGQTATRRVSAQAARLMFPLLHHFDVDLRVSATKLTAKPFDVGETAITVALKSGVLTAEFAVSDICGGQGNGHLELDAAKSRPRMQLTAALDGLTPEACIELIWPKSPIAGNAGSLMLDVSSEGGDTEELVNGVKGTMSFAMRAGQIRIDPLQVIKAAKKGNLRGWKSVLGAQRGFEALNAAFRLEQGNARSDKFEVVAGPTTMTGKGIIDIATRRLHWRIKVADNAHAQSSRVGTFVAELVDSLIVQGPIAEPTFRLERKRASQQPPTKPGTWAQMFLGAMR